MKAVQHQFEIPEQRTESRKGWTRCFECNIISHICAKTTIHCGNVYVSTAEAEDKYTTHCIDYNEQHVPILATYQITTRPSKVFLCVLEYTKLHEITANWATTCYSVFHPTSTMIQLYFEQPLAKSYTVICIRIPHLLCPQWRRLHRAGGHVPLPSPRLQMAGYGGGTASRRTANNKLTKLYWRSQ